MMVRRVHKAFVYSVFFAALVANAGSTSAVTSPANSISVAAYAALNGGDPAKAVSLYTQAIESRELAPEALANALLNRALAYQNIFKFETAVDDYSAALALDAMPSGLRARALYNRGLAEQKMSKSAMAIEDFTSALLVDSSFSHAYLARANALRENGQYLFSISDYERALKYHHPDVAHVYFGEALAFELLKRPTEAKHFLKAAVAADAAFAPAIEKLKSLGDVAELDDQAVDPILTGSIGASPAGQTEVMKQTLPQAVEPPEALLAAAESSLTNLNADEATSVAPDETVQVETPKTLTAAPVATADKKVEVASVPGIPAKVQKLALADMVQPVAQPIAPAKKPVAVAGVEPAAVEVATPASGWAVQISSATSEDAAWASWKSMQKNHNALTSLEPVVVKADLGAKGTFYRVRLQGFADQAAAQAACGKLKSGGISCYIAKASS
jgi:tetratricopeptide (TPR) repeat protein